jgi:hypothetical protein
MKIAILKWEDFLDKAHALINGNYPVDTNDPVVLAKRMFEKQKDINSSVSRDTAISTYSKQPKED